MIGNYAESTSFVTSAIESIRFFSSFRHTKPTDNELECSVFIQLGLFFFSNILFPILVQPYLTPAIEEISNAAMLLSPSILQQKYSPRELKTIELSIKSLLNLCNLFSPRTVFEFVREDFISFLFQFVIDSCQKICDDNDSSQKTVDLGLQLLDLLPSTKFGLLQEQALTSLSMICNFINKKLKASDPPAVVTHCYLLWRLWAKILKHCSKVDETSTIFDNLVAPLNGVGIHFSVNSRIFECFMICAFTGILMAPAQAITMRSCTMGAQCHALLIDYICDMEPKVPEIPTEVCCG